MTEPYPIAVATPPPIPGDHLDPPPKSPAKTLHTIEDRSQTAGVGFRAFQRFSNANTTLLAAGTTYYLFLSVFAVVALAFGITAIVGSDDLSAVVNDALTAAFPNLTGAGGLDPQALRQIGQATSVVGLLVLLYSGSGAVEAAVKSLHLIYGAPKDGRNFVLAKLRAIGWMLVIAPLILLSFAPTVLTAFAQPLLDAIGSATVVSQALLWVLTTAVALVFNFFVLWLILSNLGGIRPTRRSVVLGSVVGSVLIQIIKSLLSTIVSWSLDKPQYGAFAAPIAVLLVLYLLTTATYLAACWTAGLAEKTDAPVEALADVVDPPESDPRD